MTPRRFTDEEENKIAKEYRDGKTYTQIRDEYGCSLFTVNAILKRCGVLPRGCGDHGRIHTAQEENEIIEKYLSSTETLEMVAARNGYTQSGFSRLLSRRGVKSVVRHITDFIDKETVAQRYVSGETVQNIADSYYVSVSPIKDMLAKSGICIRGRRKHGLSGTKRYNCYRQQKRQEKNKLSDTSWTLQMEMALYEKFTACVICGGAYNLHTDHLLPISLGYGLFVDNAVVLCESCNISKGGKYISELPPEIRRKIIDASCEFQDYYDREVLDEI